MLFNHLMHGTTRKAVAQRGKNNCVVAVSEYIDAFGGNFTQEDFREAYNSQFNLNSHPDKDPIIPSTFFKTTFSDLTGYSLDATDDPYNSLSIVNEMVQDANNRVIIIYNNGIGTHVSVIDQMTYNSTSNSATFHIMDPNGGLFRDMTPKEISSIGDFVNISK